MILHVDFSNHSHPRLSLRLLGSGKALDLEALSRNLVGQNSFNAAHASPTLTGC